VKILYVARQILYNGAPKEHVFSVCKEFVRQGHKVVLFTFYPEDHFEKTNFRIIKCPNYVLGRLIKQKSIIWKFLINFLIFLFDPEIIYERYATNYLVHPVKKDIMHVLEINGWPPDYRGEQWNKLYKVDWEKTFQENLSKVSLIIATSEGEADKTRTLINDQYSKVYFIPNGVDIPYPQKQQELMLPKGEIGVGYIGGFTKLQDVDVLIRSVYLLYKKGHKISLHLVGDGDLREQSESLCSELGIHDIVKYYGWVPNSELYSMSRHFELAVVPYKKIVLERRKGGWSMKLFLYWAFRKPVIVTDLPTSQTYHENHLKRYYAVPPEDPDALAEAILYLVQNPNLVNEMVENGYRYVVENHTWEAIVNRIINAINAELF
jgi:glycosyltransferase involved in cell wall biosynthesis